MERSQRIIVSIILLCIVIIFLIGGALFYYMGLYFPFIDKVITVPVVEQRPTKVLDTMLQAMAEVNTAHYVVTGAVRSQTENVPFSLYTELYFDGGWQEQMTGQGRWSNQIQIQNLSFLIDMELQSTDEKGYFRIEEVPAVPFLDIDAVAHTWYAYTPQTDIAAAFRDIGSLKQSLAQTELVMFMERFPDELFDGSLCYRYQVRLTRAGADALVQHVPWFPLESDELFITAGAATIDLWIDKQDAYLRRIELSIPTQKRAYEFQAVINMFDETVTIEEPLSSKSLSEFNTTLFTKTNFLNLPLFGYLIGLPAEELVRDQDKDGLYDVWEPLFGTRSDMVDTDGDGFIDSDELENGYNPAGEGKFFNAP